MPEKIAEDQIAERVIRCVVETQHLAPERALEIAIGFTTAFVAAVFVVRPFLRYVSRSGFAPFAWYRIVAGVLMLGAMWAQRL